MLNSNEWKSIGIIGGLGPRASVNFYKLVIDICSQKYNAIQDYEYPPIFLSSLSIKGFNHKGLLDEDELVENINSMLRVFHELNIDVVSIACNSVYSRIEKLTVPKHIQIIDLPTVIANVVAGKRVNTVLIVSGDDIRKHKSLNNAFYKKGVSPISLDQKLQEIVDKIVLSVMAGDINSAKKDLVWVVQKVYKEFDLVLLACSELSVIFDKKIFPKNVIDTMHILANATLENSLLTGGKNVFP